MLTIDLKRLVLVVTDRMLSLDWQAARDALLLRVPGVRVVEWTNSAGISDDFRLARAVATFPKSGDGVELKNLIQESLTSGTKLIEIPPYFDPNHSIVERMK